MADQLIGEPGTLRRWPARSPTDGPRLPAGPAARQAAALDAGHGPAPGGLAGRAGPAGERGRRGNPVDPLQRLPERRIRQPERRHSRSRAGPAARNGGGLGRDAGGTRPGRLGIINIAIVCRQRSAPCSRRRWCPLVATRPCSPPRPSWRQRALSSYGRSRASPRGGAAGRQAAQPTTGRGGQPPGAAADG
jgi:hypothetical protein